MNLRQFIYYLLTLVLAFGPTSCGHQDTFKIEFTLSDQELIPEGICYSPTLKTFFVGSIAKKKIVQIAANNQVSDFVTARQDSLGEVLGIKTYEKQKWVVAVSNHPELKKSFIHVFDFAGRLVKKLSNTSSTQPTFFNDLVITPDGNIFITDSDGGSIYFVDSNLNQVSLFLQSDQLRDANGITLLADGITLVICTSRGFAAVNLVTKELRPLPFSGYMIHGIDGLYTYQNSLIGIQNVSFPESIIQYHLSNDFTEIKSATVLAFNEKVFNIPTTGAVVGDEFFFIANSQLDAYENGVINNSATLSETVIASVNLKD